jgi:hypothetical protein
MSGSLAAMQSVPRKLTTHQKAVLIQVLLAFPEQQVAVCYSPTATDALAYAQDFLTVFRVIGWTVNDAGSAEISTDQTSGLALKVSQGSSLPPSAHALRDSLRIYGIEVETCCDSKRNIASGSFVLAIGARMRE